MSCTILISVFFHNKQCELQYCAQNLNLKIVKCKRTFVFLLIMTCWPYAEFIPGFSKIQFVDFHLLLLQAASYSAAGQVSRVPGSLHHTWQLHHCWPCSDWGTTGSSTLHPNWQIKYWWLLLMVQTVYWDVFDVTIHVHSILKNLYQKATKRKFYWKAGQYHTYKD